ncbi:MAG: DNA primase [Coxiellaceae bacterium]|jgi:DNA primase|nr:DNA primase [Coxiellaceae bacterium]
MSKSIPQSFIEDLLTKIDIIDIISTRVKLRRAGNNFVGMCPFHVEKTPSFTVSRNKQFFHCFGCGIHGNAIGFIMQFENLNFIDAIKNLAFIAGTAIPETGVNYNNTNHYLYDITEKVATFFEQQLYNSKHAISYLKNRGLNKEICKKFKIGYASNDWNNLNSFCRSSTINERHLLISGLLMTKNNKYYSRFRNRIMFPIWDTRGNIVGFGGRSLSKDSVKYLNSPETPIFHKGKELYGLNEAKKSMPNLKFLIVVEGYLDVISLAQFGITNVVATLGTTISTKQIQSLLRNTQEIVFCFDGDLAGRAAAWRALENSLPIVHDGIQIKFLFLPDGYDPDSLIRKETKENFNQRLDSAITLSDFFINQLISKINPNTIDGQAKLVKISKEWLKKMPRGIFRKLLLNKIAKLININVEELDIENTIIPPLPTQINELIEETIINIPLPIENIISIILHYPEFICNIHNIDEIKNIRLNGIEILIELLIVLKQQQNLSTGTILEYWRNRREFKLLNRLACKELIVPKNVLENELISNIRLLVKLERDAHIQTLLTKATTKNLKTEERQQLQKLIMLSKTGNTYEESQN